MFCIDKPQSICYPLDGITKYGSGNLEKGIKSKQKGALVMRLPVPIKAIRGNKCSNLL